jgi:hypothetical protein
LPLTPTLFLRKSPQLFAGSGYVDVKVLAQKPVALEHRKLLKILNREIALCAAHKQKKCERAIEFLQLFLKVLETGFEPF